MSSTCPISSHIDYCGFTLDVRNDHGETPDNLTIKEGLYEVMAEHTDSTVARVLLAGTGWKPASTRRPYQSGYANQGNGIYVFYGGHPHALVELTGIGCQYARKEVVLTELMRYMHERLTRLDVAVDMMTDTRPRDFVAAGYSGRIKTRNDRVSDTGETVTLGSWHSDRFCNVYRYNEPHPRSDKLRVEFRLKREYARNAVPYIIQHGIKHLVGMLQSSYQFKHEDWRVESMQEKLPGRPDNKKSESTLMWVIKQVSPAVRKLVHEGVIDDPYQFFEEHFVPKNYEARMFDDDEEEEEE